MHDRHIWILFVLWVTSRATLLGNKLSTFTRITIKVCVCGYVLSTHCIRLSCKCLLRIHLRVGLVFLPGACGFACNIRVFLSLHPLSSSPSLSALSVSRWCDLLCIMNNIDYIYIVCSNPPPVICV